MGHLHPDELIDLAEGTRPESAAPHLLSCESCRRRLAEARALIAAAATVEVPEPSPLFWDHLSARIGAALDTEPVPSPSWTEWLLRGRTLAAAAAAMLLVAGLAAYAGWTWRTATIDTPLPSTTVAQDAPELDTDELAGDDAWDVIAAAAAAMEWEEAKVGIAARSGASERVALELSDAERAELRRLIEEEMRSGSEP